MAESLLSLLTTLAGEWTDAAKAALPPDQALDIPTLCAFVTAGWSAGASVNAAQVYLERGDGRQALDALCNGLGAAGSDWRDEQLARLKPLWKKAKVEVPFEFAKAAAKVFEALQSGKPDDAIAPGRWICAYDPKNKEAWRNLGLAYASSGRVLEAIEALMRADPTQGMQICAGVLVQVGHAAEATKVVDYASRWFARADEWLTFGGIAYRVADNPRTVADYSNAYELDADALNVSMLNAFAGVLDEIGDYKSLRTDRAASAATRWRRPHVANMCLVQPGVRVPRSRPPCGGAAARQEGRREESTA